MDKQRITITYDGLPDHDLDARLAGVLEFKPFNFEWFGQGYSLEKNKRDITFERDKK